MLLWHLKPFQSAKCGGEYIQTTWLGSYTAYINSEVSIFVYISILYILFHLVAYLEASFLSPYLSHKVSWDFLLKETMKMLISCIFHHNLFLVLKDPSPFFVPALYSPSNEFHCPKAIIFGLLILFPVHRA